MVVMDGLLAVFLNLVSIILWRIFTSLFTMAVGLSCCFVAMCLFCFYGDAGLIEWVWK